MKILILANNDVGLYKFRKELIQELLKENELYISLPMGEFVEPLINMGCTFVETAIDRRGINVFTDINLLKKYKQICKQINPDLIITYTIKPNIYGGLVAKQLGIEYAENITGLGTAFQKNGLLKKMIINLYKIALKNVKVVFFENEENRNIFISEKIMPFEKSCLLNGAGVNLEEYPYTEYPIEDGVIRFLFIGRIMKEKGIEEYLYAANEIKKEYPNVHFDIVGPIEDFYKDVIEKYTNEGIIRYYGFQKDVKPFIERCHCFVLPSYHEGMANTLLEAAAMGRPLITSNIHGCKEAVVEGKSGYLCECQCASSLFEALKTFINLSFDDRKLLSEKGRRHIKDNFNRNKVIKNTIERLLMRGNL